MEDRFKFRIWDKRFKCWLELSEETGNWEAHKDDPNISYTFFELFELNLRKGTIEIMQCTGLKDKNGELIYEGDILFHKYWVSPEMSSGGDWYEDTFEVKLPHFFLDLGKTLYSSPETLSEFCSYYEMKGNIYENPELLKGETK